VNLNRYKRYFKIIEIVECNRISKLYTNVASTHLLYQKTTSVSKTHIPKDLCDSEYYVNKYEKDRKSGIPHDETRSPRLRCSYCGHPTSVYCASCSRDSLDKPIFISVCLHVEDGRKCFEKHCKDV
jgi:hypothetical protein